MGCLFSSSSRSSDEALGGTPVVLNVYDLTPLNNYMYWFGLGIFHSGIERVFEVEPKSCPGFVYRRSIILGRITLSSSEARAFMEQLASDYHGDTYQLISKNCNHFTNDVSSKLIGRPIPGWVNRLACLGAMCNCLLPEGLKTPAVKQIHDSHAFSEDGSESFSIITADEVDQDRCLISPSSGAEVTFLKESHQ